MIVVGRRFKETKQEAVVEEFIVDPVYPDFYNMPVNLSILFDHDQNNTDVHDRLTSDYVEMGILIAMVLIGGPLNFVSLFRSFRSDPPLEFGSVFKLCRNRTGPSHDGEMAKIGQSFDLKVHLTIANLLVIWVYAFSDLCWLATSSWNGGDFMCRVVRFVHAFCFYATSNLVCTIALQRLNVAMKMDRPSAHRPRGSINHSLRSGVRRGRGRNQMQKSRLAYGAWALAFLCSVPQLFIWRTYELYPGWQQCVTMWTIERHSRSKDDHHSEFDAYIQDTVEKQEKIYNGFHLVFVFWLPVFIIFACYVLIVTKFNRRIRKQALQIAAEATAEAGYHAARVRASLAFGGSMDSGSPLLLPIAAYRSKYQSMENGRVIASSSVSVPLQRRQGVSGLSGLRESKRSKWYVCCKRRKSKNRINSIRASQDLDQAGLATASTILSATLTGVSKPYYRKSFAIATLSRAKKTTMKKTIWILLAYLLCWSPYNVLVLWRHIDRNVDLYEFEIMYNLIVLNAVVNPLIYGI